LVTDQVIEGSAQDFDRIFEPADASVTIVTEKASNLACLMVVVYNQKLSVGWRIVTDGASPVLRFLHGIELL
jgi:hypothetical protein